MTITESYTDIPSWMVNLVLLALVILCGWFLFKRAAK